MSEENVSPSKSHYSRKKAELFSLEKYAWSQETKVEAMFAQYPPWLTAWTWLNGRIKQWRSDSNLSDELSDIAIYKARADARARE